MEPARSIVIEQFTLGDPFGQDPAGGQRDQEPADRKEPVCRQVVEVSKQPEFSGEYLEIRQRADRAVGQGAEQPDGEDPAARAQRRFLARDPMLVDEVGRHDLQDRDRRGKRREADEDVEHRGQDFPERDPGVELGRQGDEQHADGGFVQRFGETGRRKNHGEHDRAGHERHDRIQDYDGQGRTHDGFLARHVRAVGDHRSHAERERKERVPQGLEHAGPLEVGKVRSEQEIQRLAGAGHAHRADQQDREDRQQRGHEPTGQPLDASTDSAVDNENRHAHEKDRGGELHRTVRGERTERGSLVHLGRETAKAPAHASDEVADAPTGDHRVVAEHDETRQHSETAHEPPPGADHLLECTDRAELRATAE